MRSKLLFISWKKQKCMTELHELLAIQWVARQTMLVLELTMDLSATKRN